MASCHWELLIQQVFYVFWQKLRTMFFLGFFVNCFCQITFELILYCRFGKRGLGNRGLAFVFVITDCSFASEFLHLLFFVLKILVSVLIVNFSWKTTLHNVFILVYELVCWGKKMIIGHKLEIHQVELVRFGEYFCMSFLELFIEVCCKNILLNQVLCLLSICTQIFLLLFCLNPASLNELLPKLTFVIELLLLAWYFFIK